jgi:hypothetical protein
MIGQYLPTTANGTALLQPRVYYGTQPATANLTIVGLPRIRMIVGKP